jgi:holo-[acyl-carrier protein] synthase
MIMGLGMDLVEIPRIRSFHARWGERGLRRIFTAAELEYCLRQADPAPSLAARFAAKEAFFKAVGQGWGRGGDWREVEVDRTPRGVPRLRWTGRAAAAVRAVGARRGHLTLSHARSTAGAVVILEE